MNNTFQKCILNNESICPICTDINKHFYRCSQCKYYLCNNCYDSYFNQYNFTTCPHCRIRIIIYDDQNSNYLGVLENNSNSNNCVFRNISVILLIVVCYFLGFLVTNKHYSFPLINIMYGLLFLTCFVLILCLLFVICVPILRYFR